MAVIHTERLILRPLEMSDIAALAAMYADDQVMQYIGDGRPIPRERAERELRYYVERPSKLPMWAMVLRDGGDFVGRCGLLTWELDGQRDVEIVIILTREHWGRGFATEAVAAARDYGFRSLDIPRLISMILPDNGASARVSERCGMRLARETTFRGEPVHIYQVERDAWEALPPRPAEPAP